MLTRWRRVPRREKERYLWYAFCGVIGAWQVMFLVLVVVDAW